ncbi:cAMP response element binding [Desmophyllum pertusum]|uniref:cAMP response element binding n=1 Tax=Desmophyllum pertusum TaxID=174260 RepID=A0A9W9ZC79_9CNID|nr:cAMP response element binding [Desmophyllum pertusum]
MEVFNQAYDELTGANSFKNANSSNGCQIFSDKSSPKDRTQDRKLLFKISSLLDKKEIEVTSYPEDLFEEQEHTDVSDIDVSGEQDYLCDEQNDNNDAQDVVFTKTGSDGTVTLTDEEKETFASEGLPVPSRIPLTKAEERALKRIRRKIKNKLSAQESRRKKKEYVEGLEKRVETCNSDNSILRQKVDSLESTVRALLTELNRLRKVSLEKESRETKQMKSRGTQTGTCLKCLMKRSATYRQQNLVRLEKQLRQNNNFCKEPYTLARLKTHT